MDKKDYYKVLGVDRTATQEQIKSACNRQTLKYHPDRHADKTEAEKQRYAKMFMEVREAYEVLSDPVKKERYDKYGTAEPGHFDGFSGFSGFGGDFKGFDLGSFAKSFKFGGDDLFESHFSFGSNKGPSSAKKREREAVEFPLKCTLSELFTGCVKKMKVRRRLLDGRTTEDIVEVVVKPGYKKGTKFTFPEKGDQVDDGSFQDLRIVLEEKEDLAFKRAGNDLECKIEITLKELIGGFSRAINLPWGRVFTFTNRNLFKVGGWSVVSGWGMPLSRDPNRKGDLKVMVVVNMPSLSPSQVDSIMRAL
jgi:DnaJ family protein B protein 4